jgi:hypothetical protein
MNEHESDLEETHHYRVQEEFWECDDSTHFTDKEIKT